MAVVENSAIRLGVLHIVKWFAETVAIGSPVGFPHYECVTGCAAWDWAACGGTQSSVGRAVMPMTFFMTPTHS